MHLIVIYMVIMVLWHLVASLACMKFDVTAFPGRQVERRRPESGQQKASLWNYAPQLVRPRIYSLCTSKSESETVRSYQKTLSWCENYYSLHLFAWGVIQQILYVYMIPSKREVVACFGAIPDGAATPVVVRCIPIGPVLKRCSSRIIKR